MVLSFVDAPSFNQRDSHGTGRIVKYVFVVWSPHAELLKSVVSVQWRFTKRLPGCCQLSYSGRLAKLNLDSLELRRLKADSTCVYKILF